MCTLAAAAFPELVFGHCPKTFRHESCSWPLARFWKTHVVHVLVRAMAHACVCRP